MRLLRVLSALGGADPAPVLVAGQDSTAAAALSWTPTLPAGIIAGEMLFGLASFGRQTYANAPFPWQAAMGSAAWDITHWFNAAPGSNWCGALTFRRIATGADDLTIESTTSEQFGSVAVRIWRIRRGVSLAGIERADNDGLSGNWADPPLLTLPASRRRLWGCAVVSRSSGSTANAPTGWGNHSFLQSGASGGRLSAAWRTQGVASENPPAFTGGTNGFGGPRMSFTWAIA
jgi:hypothetical protein